MKTALFFITLACAVAPTFAQVPDSAQRALTQLDADVAAARKRAVQQLENVKQFEMRRGNLEGANAIQVKIAELSGGSAPVTAGAPPPTVPEGRGKYTIAAVSDKGTEIGPGMKGQKVKIEYVDGQWVTNGREMVSPDLPPHGFAQVALHGVSGGLDELIVVVPGGTKNHPYTETLKKNYEELRLQINDTSKGDNRGEVVYRASIH